MKGLLLAVAALVLLAGTLVASLSQGPLSVPPGELVTALVGPGTADAETAVRLRGPRALAGLLVGAGLAVAGAAFQTVFRNPLVSPDLLGVSAGAALGAATALLIGASFAFVQAASFAGGVGTVLLALAAARLGGGRDPRLSLVLCGIVAGALASAGLALVLSLADPYTQLPAISYWLLGSLSRVAPPELASAAGPALLGVVVVLSLRSRLDVLGLGDEQARALGLPAAGLRALVIGGATLTTAAAVSIAGVVGWVGLLAPHAARLVVGSEARRLLPASAVLGGTFVLLIDLAARSLGPVEVPLGLLSAAVGAPAFLALFIATGRSR
jgi:iron complex transport system permease protein